MFTLLSYLSSEVSSSLRGLWAIRQKGLSLKLVLSYPFGSWFLLALRALSNVSKSSGGLVEFGLAFIDYFASDLFWSGEGVAFVVEEE